MAKVKIELNSPGVRALLRSPEMQAVLKDRAADLGFCSSYVLCIHRDTSFRQ